MSGTSRATRARGLQRCDDAEIRIRDLDASLLSLLVAGSTMVSLAHTGPLGYELGSLPTAQLFGEVLGMCVPTTSRSQMIPS